METESYDVIRHAVDQIKRGDICWFVCLIEHQGANVNYDQTESGDSVLCIAAENGNTELVKYLISKGADINHVGKISKNTPLSVAVKGGHIETAKALIELGAEKDIVDLLSITNSPEMIRMLLVGQLGIYESNNNSSARSIELLEASRKPINISVDQIEDLIKHGVDVNYIDEHGMSALAYAVSSGHIGIAKSLIRFGADTNIEVDGDDLLTLAININLTPVNFAIDYKTLQNINFVYNEVLKMSKSANVNDPRPSKALHRAASLGLNRCVIALICQFGANINYKSTDGSTALIAAVRNGHHGVVKELISRGANVYIEIQGHNFMDIAVEREDFYLIDIFTAKGLTTKQIDAKQFASSKDIRKPRIFKSISTVKWLVSNGAYVDFGIEENDTALLRAVHTNDTMMACVLTSLGAKTDMIIDGKNLLDIAIDSACILMIQKLLDAGLTCQKRDSKDHFLNLALNEASSYGSINVVRYLISIGADINSRPESRVPPVYKAARFGHYEIAKMLLDLKADTGIEVDGEDFVDMAIQSDNRQILCLLSGNSFKFVGMSPGGKPSLAAAIQNGCLISIEYLLEIGVDYYQCSEPDNRTPLWFCSRAYSTSIHDSKISCRMLLDHVRKKLIKVSFAGYINHKDAKGQTALHFFSQNGDIELTSYLLAQGADPNIPDAKHKRPIDLTQNEQIKLLLTSHKKLLRTK